MPTYIFKCDETLNGCGHVFEQNVSMSEISSYQPKCPICRCSKPVHRDYLAENISCFGPSVTLGTQIDKNSSKSSDELHYIHQKNNAYKQQEYTGPLPEGAEPIKKDSSGKRIVSTDIPKKDTKHANRR